eukprot:TRINITY_DN13543_c0_g1_i1.p1 TRINITY_DN13543_c0_g1~~TRINITY_DN13543_c0_g1_i1.p1  ORF type:complete len:165 (+),score=19.41 TRINITY_DN13543_c0_g1_i1:89-583(+)
MYYEPRQSRLTAAGGIDGRPSLGTWRVSEGPDGAVQMSVASTYPSLWAVAHKMPISCVVGDALKLVTASFDASVRVWDAAAHTPVRILTGHSNMISALDLAPDGLSLASGAFDSRVVVWIPRNVSVQPDPDGDMAASPSHSDDMDGKNIPGFWRLQHNFLSRLQ